MSAIIVPPRIVYYAREAAYRLLGFTAAAIEQVIEDGGEGRRERCREPIEHFGAVRALLELIGWESDEPPRPATIILARDRETLLQALRCQLEAERGLLDDDPTFEGAERQIQNATARVREIESFIAGATPELAGGL